MKTKDFFKPHTLKISYPFGKTILGALLILPILLIGVEIILRLFPFPETILVPTIDKEINYPEIDIKFSQLAKIEKKTKINCFLLGNSMIEVGLDPAILNNQPELFGVNAPNCYNMGLSNMMPESSSEIAGILNKRSSPSLIIIGISPIDFFGEDKITREFNNSPWFQYQKGNYSSEGWLIENSILYRSWLAFCKYRNPVYQGEMNNLLMLIESNGIQVRQKKDINFQIQSNIYFPDFQISAEDLNGFISMTNLNTSTLKIVVIEMPVYPDFLPYYIPGGENGYEENFIKPIRKILIAKEIPFIRTQPNIKEIVNPDGWRDHFHLSKEGAEQLSTWLVTKTNDLQ
jgi:hypothetical protein